MSEPVLKQRQTIDLDDFERRLRQSSAADGRGEDPLAELARLVGEPYDPFGDVFAREATGGAPHGTGGGFQPEAHAHELHHALHAATAAPGRREPGLAGDIPRLFGDFAAIEAGLRGNTHGQVNMHGQGNMHGQAGAYRQDQFAAPHAPEQPFYADPSAAYAVAGQPPLEGDGEWTGPAAEALPAAGDWNGARAADASRSRRPMMLMAASIAVGVIGIGAAFALKGRVSSSPREIKTIMADATPTKIQPPPEAAPDAGTDGAAFGKGAQSAPARLVNREEQPVDITQAVQDNVARAAQMNPPTDASSVPVPPSPGQMQTQLQNQARSPAQAAIGRPQPGAAGGDPIGEQVQSFGLAEIPTPKRVKVVSVRPDGSIMPSNEAPTSASPGPRQPEGKTSDRAGPVARAATPKTVPAKTTSRVASAPRSADNIEQLAAATDDTPAAKAPRKPKPQRVASAEPGDGAAATVPAAEDGGFAVQLAAPGSEADARTAQSKLSKKFSDALGGHRIGFRKAESNGKSVFRVRVSSLSRADAVSLCEKLKADGGSCFVAKN